MAATNKTVDVALVEFEADMARLERAIEAVERLARDTARQIQKTFDEAFKNTGGQIPVPKPPRIPPPDTAGYKKEVESLSATIAQQVRIIQNLYKAGQIGADEAAQKLSVLRQRAAEFAQAGESFRAPTREVDRFAASAAQATRGIQGIKNQAQGLQNINLRNLSEPLAALAGIVSAGAITSGLQSAAMEAARAENTFLRLDRAIQSIGGNQQAYRNTVSELARQFKVTDDTAAGALVTLTNIGVELGTARRGLELFGASAVASGRSAADGFEAFAAVIASGTSIAAQGIGIAANFGKEYNQIEESLKGATLETIRNAQAVAVVNKAYPETKNELAALSATQRGYIGVLQDNNLAVTQLRRELGTNLLPLFTRLTQAATQLVRDFSALPEPVKQAATGVTLLTAAILGGAGLMTALNALKPALAALFGPAGLLLLAVGALAALASAQGWLQLRNQMDETATSAERFARRFGVALDDATRSQVGALSIRKQQLEAEIRSIEGRARLPGWLVDGTALNKDLARLDQLKRELTRLDELIVQVGTSTRRNPVTTPTPGGNNQAQVQGLTRALVDQAKQLLRNQQAAEGNALAFDAASQALEAFRKVSDLNARAIAAAQAELSAQASRAAKAAQNQHQAAQAVNQRLRDQASLNREIAEANRDFALSLRDSKVSASEIVRFTEKLRDLQNRAGREKLAVDANLLASSRQLVRSAQEIVQKEKDKARASSEQDKQIRQRLVLQKLLQQSVEQRLEAERFNAEQTARSIERSFDLRPPEFELNIGEAVAQAEREFEAGLIPVEEYRQRLEDAARALREEYATAADQASTESRNLLIQIVQLEKKLTALDDSAVQAAASLERAFELAPPSYEFNIDESITLATQEFEAGLLPLEEYRQRLEDAAQALREDFARAEDQAAPAARRLLIQIAQLEDRLRRLDETSNASADSLEEVAQRNVRELQGQLRLFERIIETGAEFDLDALKASVTAAIEALEAQLKDEGLDLEARLDTQAALSAYRLFAATIESRTLEIQIETRIDDTANNISDLRENLQLLEDSLETFGADFDFDTAAASALTAIEVIEQELARGDLTLKARLDLTRLLQQYREFLIKAAQSGNIPSPLEESAAPEPPQEMTRAAKLFEFATSKFLRGAPILASALEGAAVGGPLGVLLALIAESEGFKQALAIINPLLQVVADSMGAFLVPLLPLLHLIASVLTPILQIFSATISALLLPILRALFPVLKGFGIAVTFVAIVFAEAFNALANIIRIITFGAVDLRIDTTPLYKSLQEIWNLTYDQAGIIKEANKELEKQALNLPENFRQAAYRFGAVSRTALVTDMRARLPVEPTGGAIYITVQGDPDPAVTTQRVVTELERRSYIRRGSPRFD